MKYWAKLYHMASKISDVMHMGIHLRAQAGKYPIVDGSMSFRVEGMTGMELTAKIIGYNYYEKDEALDVLVSVSGNLALLIHATEDDLHVWVMDMSRFTEKFVNGVKASMLSRKSHDTMITLLKKGRVNMYAYKQGEWAAC